MGANAMANRTTPKRDQEFQAERWSDLAEATYSTFALGVRRRTKTMRPMKRRHRRRSSSTSSSSLITVPEQIVAEAA